MIAHGLLIGLRVGGAYAIGNHVGGWVATKTHLATSDATRIGIKIAVGVAAFALVSVIF